MNKMDKELFDYCNIGIEKMRTCQLKLASKAGLTDSVKKRGKIEEFNCDLSHSIVLLNEVKDTLYNYRMTDTEYDVVTKAQLHGKLIDSNEIAYKASMGLRSLDKLHIGNITPIISEFGRLYDDIYGKIYSAFNEPEELPEKDEFISDLGKAKLNIDELDIFISLVSDDTLQQKMKDALNELITNLKHIELVHLGGK